MTHIPKGESRANFLAKQGAVKSWLTPRLCGWKCYLTGLFDKGSNPTGDLLTPTWRNNMPDSGYWESCTALYAWIPADPHYRHGSQQKGSRPASNIMACARSLCHEPFYIIQFFFPLEFGHLYGDGLYPTNYDFITGCRRQTAFLSADAHIGDG